jgi:HTH-type transcriptional regulator/antitoxin HigA
MLIINEVQYREHLDEYKKMVVLTSENLPREKVEKMRVLANALAEYEDQFVKLPEPDSLVGMIELRMFERKLKQKDLALLLDESNSRISEILNGKRKVSIDIARKLFKVLDIPAEFILEKV